MFADLFEKFLKNFSPEKVRKTVKELRTRYPGASPEVLARRLVDRSSVKCSVAVSGAAALPGIGIPASLLADLSYVLDRECYLVATIAYLYGHELSTDEAVKDILYCIGLQSGAYASEKVLSRVITQGLKGEAIREFFKRLGIALSQRFLARVIPLVGPLVGGACSYTAVRGVGRIAMEMYSRRTPTTPPVAFKRA
jgi:hypothetical protein